MKVYMSKKQQPINVSTISHACKRCGNCCRCRGDIFLTPLSVLHISKYLGMSCEEFIGKYCERADFAEVHLRATGPQKECIFLRSTKGKSSCAIYEVRPLQCYLFPLANTGFYTFKKQYAPLCAVGTKAIPVEQFADENSNFRYQKDLVFQRYYLYALEYFEKHYTQNDKDAVFSFLFYNESEEELESKFHVIMERNHI